MSEHKEKPLFEIIQANNRFQKSTRLNQKVRDYELGMTMFKKLEEQGKCEVIDADNPDIPYCEHNIYVNWHTEILELFGGYQEVVGKIMQLFDEVVIGSNGEMQYIFTSVLYKEEK